MNKCTILDMLLNPSRKKSIAFELIVWFLVYSFGVASLAVVGWLFGREFDYSAMSVTSATLTTFFLFLMDINNHPYQEDEAQKSHLESDKQMQRRNKRHLHDFLRRISGLAAYLLISLALWAVTKLVGFILGFAIVQKLLSLF